VALDFQTISGSSILQATNGPGWAEAVLLGATALPPGSMAFWENQLLGTSPVGDFRKRHGRMLTVIFGSLEDRELMQVV
jgi:hypothetical protein